LYDRLSARFGAEVVFMDVDDIKPGANFVSLIDEKIGSCDALIAVMGKEWLASKDKAGNLRLGDAGDFVRLEIATALKRNILVIPTLVAGAGMPSARDLPAPLAELAQRQAVELTDKDFARDVDQLIEALEKVPQLKHKEPAARETAAKAGAMRTIAWVAMLPIVFLAAIVFWQWQKPNTARLEGVWEAQVNYSWGGSFKETFAFKVNGEKLLGTASFLGAKHGIQDGKIEGERISFVVPFRSMSGSDITEHKAQYTGMISGNEVHLVMQDDRGYPPIEFVAKKSDRSA
ncbi:MAG: toll/interleukin-1 receptor domain-containing protein, partial [Candidatus Binatia bacterium]